MHKHNSQSTLATQLIFEFNFNEPYWIPDAIQLNSLEKFWTRRFKQRQQICVGNIRTPHTHTRINCVHVSFYCFHSPLFVLLIACGLHSPSIIAAAQKKSVYDSFRLRCRKLPFWNHNNKICAEPIKLYRRTFDFKLEEDCFHYAPVQASSNHGV